MTERLVVIGGGHAGIEAAAASARMGVPTVLVTMSIESIGRMSCNPAVGGVAKGNLAVEVDALGGLMGRAADAAGIQFKMLNRSRGPAVWGPRAQEDRELYARWVRHAVFSIPNLEVRQGMASAVRVERGRVVAVGLEGEELIPAGAAVVTAGTFMNGVIHIGAKQYSGGRTNEPSSVHLSECLRSLGLRLERFKTGTPPRVLASSVDFAKLEPPLCLYALNNGVPAETVAPAVDLTAEQVERVFKDIHAKRRATRYLHMRPLLVAPVAEV